jgi:hypothetical protein
MAEETLLHARAETEGPESIQGEQNRRKMELNRTENEWREPKGPGGPARRRLRRTLRWGSKVSGTADLLHLDKFKSHLNINSPEN